MAGIGANARVVMLRQPAQIGDQGAQCRLTGEFLEHHADAQFHVQAGFGIGDDRQQGGQPGGLGLDQAQHLRQIGLLEQVVKRFAHALGRDRAARPDFQFGSASGAGQLERADAQPGHRTHCEGLRGIGMAFDVDRFETANHAALEQFGQAGQHGRAMRALAGDEEERIGRN